MGLGGEYAVLTLHRPSNVDDPDTLGARLQPILGLAERMPVVFPVHPRTRHVLAGIGAGERPGLRLVEPMGYLEFLGLMGGARIVLTDSGGVQEETTVLGIPCVTLRENTERPVTVAHGTNRLAGVEPEGVRQAIAQALDSSRAPRMPELWDGKAAERIVAALARDLEG
jgi:UDP-N-acetylglucosamine 2-epimerase (non-hydrolysing)